MCKYFGEYRIYCIFGRSESGAVFRVYFSIFSNFDDWTMYSSILSMYFKCILYVYLYMYCYNFFLYLGVFRCILDIFRVYLSEYIFFKLCRYILYVFDVCI